MASTDDLVAAAVRVLRSHLPDPGGFCLGCLTIWRRLAPFPCTQVEWAIAVHAAAVGRGD
jgi:hypothetical protein